MMIPLSSVSMVVVAVAAEDMMVLLIIGVFYFYICLWNISKTTASSSILINSFGSINKI